MLFSPGINLVIADVLFWTVSQEINLSVKNVLTWFSLNNNRLFTFNQTILYCI